LQRNISFFPAHLNLIIIREECNERY